jgi:hypothetical protein
MSQHFAYLPMQAFQDKNLGLIDLRVLAAIWSFGKGIGDSVWPSRELIRQRLGNLYCDAVISRAISRLVGAGYLTRKQSRQGPNIYVLQCQTVTDSVTVTESVTVTDSIRLTVTDSDDIEETKKKPKKELTPLTPRADVGDLFARFWAAYPKKLSKGQAERTFAQLKPNEQLLAEILLGLRRAMTSDTRFTGEKRYTPNASTWLNAKGWQDEHDQEIPKPATSAAYGQTQRNGQQPRNGAHHATHQRPDNSAPAKVARAIAERDAARQPAGPGVPPDDFIELGSGDYWAVAY